jgi:hypothetical protein
MDDDSSDGARKAWESMPMSRVWLLCGVVKSVVVRRQKNRTSTNLLKALPTVLLLLFQNRGMPSGKQETKHWMNREERSRIAVMVVTALLPTNNKKRSLADTIQHKDGVSTESNSSIDAAGPFCKKSSAVSKPSARSLALANAAR